jgi:hypothetical protein
LLPFFLICAGATDSCLRHFQFAQTFKFAETKTNIARSFSAFFANAARNGIEFPTTDVTFPRDYIFLCLYNDAAQREPDLSAIRWSRWLCDLFGSIFLTSSVAQDSLDQFPC